MKRRGVKHLIVPVASLCSVVIVGTVLVFASQAATSVSTIEPEDGAKTTNAIIGSDASASNGQYAQFTSNQSSGRTCPAYPAFPDTNCTGVPAGTALTTVNSITTTADNQVIDAKLVTGTIIVNHNNVTIKNSRIKGSVENNAKKLVIQDSDLGPDTCPASGNGGTRLIGGDDFTLTRAYLHNNGDDLVYLGGSSSGSGTIIIEDSLMNNTCYYTGDHLDVLQYYDPGNVGHVIVRHSNFDSRTANVAGEKGNSVMIWADSPGNGSTLEMYNNLFAGGNYSTMLFDAVKNSRIVLNIHDNQYVKNSYTYGPCTSTNSIPYDGVSGLIFTGNKFSDGSAITNC